MNQRRARSLMRAKAHASRTAKPALSPAHSSSWLRMVTVHPALPYGRGIGRGVRRGAGFVNQTPIERSLHVRFAICRSSHPTRVHAWTSS